MAVPEEMDDRASPVYAETPDHQVTRVHPVAACRDLAPMGPQVYVDHRVTQAFQAGRAGRVKTAAQDPEVTTAATVRRVYLATAVHQETTAAQVPMAQWDSPELRVPLG